jgi:hypothetical protein
MNPGVDSLRFRKELLPARPKGSWETADPKPRTACPWDSHGGGSQSQNHVSR